ncbi:MAG: type II secretion system protein [Bacilli bacterium]|nr:type II secretion system protein [Bacilli bacterium]
MKRLTKKGFTLVELLAVIVVLAVIMLLAVNAVIPQMNKARKNAFVTEANAFIDAAGTYYQNAMLTGETGITAAGGCVDVSKLIGEYIEKDGDDYAGSVKIEIDNATNKATYTIWLSNGQYQIEGKKSAELNESVVKDFTAAASTTCSAS